MEPRRPAELNSSMTKRDLLARHFPGYALRMANQGYPDEGADKRLLPHLGFLQRALIIRKPAPTDVERKTIFGWTVTLQKWPPFLMLEKPIGQVAQNCQECGSSQAHDVLRQIRVGWTWREHEKYYIPGAAIKKETELEPDYANRKDNK